MVGAAATHSTGSRETHEEGSSGAAAHWPVDTHRVLRDAGISIAAYVPDAGLARLIRAFQDDRGALSVMLTSEQEGVGVVAGAWLGGRRGVLLMQSSGVGNCVNAFSMLETCSLPFLTVVTMRGEWGEFNPWQVPMGQSTQRCLENAGLLVYRAHHAADIPETVAAAARLAFNSRRALAVLISQRILGAKTFGEEP